MIMAEDDLRRKDNGPENLALNMARTADGGRVTSMRGKLKKAGWDDRFLLKLVSSAASLAEDAEPEKIKMRRP